MSVHNHGPEEGRGLRCNEMRIGDGDGDLIGACMARYAIRYTPGTEMARRFPPVGGLTPGLMWRTEAEAEGIRRRCPNVNDMEVYEIQGWNQ